ncbi:MAG: hypothetical protein J6X59_06255 [Bacteroidales bacterium]|nr:hypothetical protein [Bacteroidales bacterium]
MKRLIIYILLPLALLTACSHEAETPSASAFYGRYAQRQELKVAEVDGFKLSDTVRINVVMLQAESDEAWQQLLAEFDIRGDEGTVSWLGDIENPSLRVQWNGTPVMRVIASHEKHTVGFYRIENEAQYDALIDYQLNKMNNEN